MQRSSERCVAARPAVVWWPSRGTARLPTCAGVQLQRERIFVIGTWCGAHSYRKSVPLSDTGAPSGLEGLSSGEEKEGWYHQQNGDALCFVGKTLGKAPNHRNSIEQWLAVGGGWRLAVGGGWR